MNSAKPPRLAAWVLQEFGPDLNQEALAGDLNEAFQQGRSKGWYWRQVLAAVRWRRLLFRLLLSALFVGLWTTSPDDGPAPILLSRPVDIAVLSVAYLVSLFAPGIKRRRLRVLLGLVIAAAFGLVCFYKPNPVDYWSFLCMVAFNFVLIPKARPKSHSLTVRELVFGNPNAERQRLLEKLHLAMLQETDPQKRQAYAESIAALKRNAPPALKPTQ